MSTYNPAEAGVDTESFEFRAAVEQAAEEKHQADLRTRGLVRAPEEQITAEIDACRNNDELRTVLRKHGMLAGQDD